MDARATFERTRRDVQRLRDVSTMLMYDCDDWKPEQPGRTGTSDPTMTMAMKRDKLESERDALVDRIGRSLVLIQRVRDGLGEKYASVLEWRYIDGDLWHDITHDHRVPRTTARDRRDVALDWVDSIGIDKLLREDYEI